MLLYDFLKIYAIKKYQYFVNATGSSPHIMTPEKNILMIGATGSGKSTLIDGFINYILGVNFEDDFRFTIIDLKENEIAKLEHQVILVSRLKLVTLCLSC